MTPNPSHHLARCVALVTTILSAACNGETGISTGTGGGHRNQPSSCATGPIDNPWRNARLTGDRTLPVKCPFHVQAPQNIDFAANVYGPKATTTLNGDVTLNPIQSVYDGLTVVSSTWRDWSDDPNNSDGRMVQLTGLYLAGHARPDLYQAPWSHDSGTVTVTGTLYGTANAWITMSARII